MVCGGIELRPVGYRGGGLRDDGIVADEAVCVNRDTISRPIGHTHWAGAGGLTPGAQRAAQPAARASGLVPPGALLLENAADEPVIERVHVRARMTQHGGRMP
jgi:hypothetical protein